ncbi:hypothetical protein [Actinacidiphila glaucinigra]|uniref:hypothetical protein n=1 Tax=Actinacidiphila glaucinigra TaxID=235986 RepID=UPI0035D76ACF
MSAVTRSRTEMVSRAEAVIAVLLLASWASLSLVYDDAVGAELLDGPWLPLGFSVVAVSSLALTWWLKGRQSAGLRAAGHVITIMRVAVVLLLCLLVAYELHDLAGGLGVPDGSDIPPSPAG